MFNKESGYNNYVKLGAVGIFLLLIFGFVLDQQNQRPILKQAQAEPIQKADIDTKGSKAEDWGIAELTSPIFKSVTGKNRACVLPSDTVTYIDPIPKIIELAKKHRLLMINESHTKPLHRVFVAKLSQALAKTGFDYMGIEPLSRSLDDADTMTKFMQRGYPLFAELTYLRRDPIIGQAIEMIIASGYDLFAIETDLPMPLGTQSRIAHRESNNADRVIKFMGQNPKRKFVLYTGPHHLKEELDYSGNAWLAKFIKDKSKIDPLTIAQTDCYGRGYFDKGELGYAMPIDQNGTPISFGGFDVIVIPPVEDGYRGRPLWLKTALGRQYVDIPENLKFDDQYTYVEAINLDRHENAGAEDNIYRKPYSNKVLALRPGRYRLETTNKNKELLASIEYRVEKP